VLAPESEARLAAVRIGSCSWLMAGSEHSPQLGWLSLESSAVPADGASRTRTGDLLGAMRGGHGAPGPAPSAPACGSWS